MPVGELFLSAFLQVLFDRLTSPELLGFLRQEGLYSKIKKWEDTLKMIQAVLGDAEDKQLKNRAVKMWLDDLQDLAYDVEDILDELATEAFARNLKMEQQEATKFRKLVPARFSNLSLGAIKFSSRMKSSVKDVTSRFDQLCKLRGDLGLKVITGGTSLDAALQRPPTSSHPTERAVYGRDADKTKILEMVLKNEPTDANFLVIPIVGMGGVGKTTLAREVFNDSEVESFEVKGWVCVSDGNFDVTRISKSILENITGSSSSPNDLATVQDQLKKEVMGKKFLLVLDDIWSKDYGKWEILQSPFAAGAPGSRIIVTTRLEDVALKMRPSGFHGLDLLHGEDCWLVFSMCAFENGVIPTHPNIESIQQKVIEKSVGLPLAAKTLGGFLRSRKVDEWMEILNSKLWDLSENDNNQIPAALKLSYHHLPSHLKRCFAYCAIFPKDYEFKEQELVFLWMAEGLIQQSTRNKQPEDVGHEYFKDLLSRSMFQLSSSEYNSSKVVMHDLVHDLAEWAFGDIRLDGELAANKQPGELKKVRHFSYTMDQYDCKNKFAVFDEARDLKARLRTFLPMFGRWVYGSNIINWVPSNLLPKLKRLRVLSLRSYSIFELPDSIGGLKHLRYLNLSQTKIRSLPESTALLYNLQILMLRDCSLLAKLPSNFRYLTKLRHFDIRGAILIKEMPSGMKELESLQMLSDFIVGKGVGSNLKDLKSLKMLRGELRISRLDKVADCDPADLILRDKEDLKELLLEWGYRFDDSRDADVEKDVLDMLQPHQHLEKLTINCYGGTRFPSWVGHASFINVTVLRLQSCEKCTSLPALGLLLSLKDLTIKGMKILQRIGCELYGDEKPFQSLKTLCFEDLPEWENWEPNKENKYVDAFTCLQEFSIVNCPKLSGRLPDCLPSLEKLKIKNCKQLEVSFSRVPMLRKLEIDGCKELACNSPIDSKSLKSMTLADISEFGNWFRQQNFLKVECLKLKITCCEQLMNLWHLNDTFVDKSPQGLQSFISITELQIENCSNLISFPEVCFLVNLSSLEIINCDALTSLPKGMNDKNASLGSLKMKVCNSLTFIVRGKLPSSLKKLEIENCEKLEYLWDDNEESCTSVVDEENPNNTNTSLLEHLRVDDCSSLKCLSSSGLLPQKLRTLFLLSLPNLESIVERFHNNKSLEEICVCGCRNLKSLPEGLFHLVHLRKIGIYECESIECLGEEGPPNNNLSELTIEYCEKLKALPNWFHSLNSLKRLSLSRCQSMTSFPEEGFPTNLRFLFIEGLNVKMYKAVLEWGLHNLTSLTSLLIVGHPEAESFPQQELEMTFPPSLTYLYISSFPNLKWLMGNSFRNLNSLDSLVILGCPNLTSFPEIALPSSLQSLRIQNCPNLKSISKLGLPSSLQYLQILNCPNLKSFPEQGLPSSLLELRICDCQKLKEECKRDKGKEWSKISHIPCVEIESRGYYRNIYDPRCWE